MYYLSYVYFVSQPIHVSAIFVAHYKEVYCIIIIIIMYVMEVGHLLTRSGS